MNSQPVLIADDRMRSRALERVLAPTGKARATMAAVRSLLAYCQNCRVRCDAWMIPLAQGHTHIVVMVSPGRMGLLLIPAAVESDRELHGLLELLRGVCESYRAQGLNYLQALTECDDAFRRELLMAAGLRPITQLQYLERNATHPWIDPPPESCARWVSFSEAGAADFSAVIRATYSSTLDCPELSDRRSDSDVLAAHQSSGEFSPTRWEIAHVDGAPAGCLLLNRVVGADAFEVAYMGVTPAYRRRGVGTLLLRRALEKTRREHARMLTLAVDARNVAARRLYDRFAFRAIALRDAYLRFLDDAAARRE